jgi:hypothetical protein
VEVVEGREMLDAAERIAQRMRLSGFFGLDFMVEHATGAAYLIEMNARSTQPCSLALGRGRNLTAAIYAQVAGLSEPDAEPVTPLNRIAYFPKPPGTMTAALDLPVWSYYYDVPADEPALVELLLHQWPERGWLGQWLDARRGIDRGTAKSRRPAVFEPRKGSRSVPARGPKGAESPLPTGTHPAGD